jgi:hypothetical protein
MINESAQATDAPTIKAIHATPVERLPAINLLVGFIIVMVSMIAAALAGQR